MRRFAPPALVMVLVCAVVVASALVACKPTEVYRRPPNLRGVTVPLPPPTYQEGLRIEVAIEGSVSEPPTDAGQFVYLWESISEAGRYVRPDETTGEFVFEEVSVAIGESCLSTRYDFDEGDSTASTYYRIELFDDDPIRCEDPQCSAPDEAGACVCVVEWTTGC